MHISVDQKASGDFDADTYIQILVAITKADPSNGRPEKEFVRRQAGSYGVNFDRIWEHTDKSFEIGHVNVSRRTALTILRDCINLASLDGNYSLTERERIFSYSEKLKIPLADVAVLEKWVDDSKILVRQWKKLVAGELL